MVICIITGLMAWSGACLSDAHGLTGPRYQAPGGWVYQGQTDLTSAGLEPVTKVALTGGHYWQQIDFEIKAPGRYVVDFTDISIIGLFRHIILDAQGNIIADMQGGIQSSAANPFFLRHGREIDLSAGHYRLLAGLDSPFFLAATQPILYDLNAYQQIIKPGNAIALICLGILLGLMVYYAVQAILFRRLYEALYALLILGYFVFNGMALLLFPELLGIHWIYLAGIFLLFSNGIYVLFVVSLLEIRQDTHPRLYAASRILLVIIVGFIVLTAFMPNWSLEFSRYCTGLLLSYGLAAGIIGSHKGNTTARIYLLSIGASFVLIITTAYTASLSIYALTIEHLGLVSVTLEAMLLALALSYKIAPASRENEQGENCQRQIMDMLDDIYWMSDDSFEKVRYFRSGQNRLGRDTSANQDGSPAPFTQDIHPDDMEQVLLGLENLKAGLPFIHEYRIVRADGATNWVFNRGFPIRDKSGKVAQYNGVMQDITKRKQMDGALKNSEAKFRSIIEVSPIPMAINDAQQNITFLNPAFVRVFGYGLADIPTVEDWWVKAYPDPAYRLWVRTTWYDSLENNAHNLPMKIVVNCKDNSIKTALVSGTELNHDFAGEYLVILHDITQRKQFESQLNSIFNASVEGIITIDLSDIIVSANASIETIFGYRPTELIGHKIDKIMMLPSIQLDYCNLPNTMKSISKIWEVDGLHKNGSTVPLDLTLAAFLNDGVKYLTAIVRDVSTRKLREQMDKEHLYELAHTTRLGLMGEMASGIAHEVNQPLAAISFYIQASLNLIQAENADFTQLANILGKAQEQALRAGQIIHRMRDFVKPNIKLCSPTDINKLIHDAVSLSIAEIKENNITLSLELDENMPPIHVDHIQIEQVVINLIRNSIDALKNMPEPFRRNLTITACPILENSIEVRVKDNGVGIAQNQQNQILTPFYSTKADGMGMGLSISRSLIEAYDGTLRFKSEPGKGTTFCFTLPIQKEVKTTL